MKGLPGVLLRAEGGFNLLGYIPFLGTLTGALRIFLGGILAWVGSILIACAVVCGLFSWVTQHKGLMTFWRKFAQASAAFGFNNVLNVKRGFFELVPVLGGGACFFYDRMMGKEQLLPYREFPELKG